MCIILRKTGSNRQPIFMTKTQQVFNPFLEPVDHILERAGICSNRSFKAFIKNHQVEIISGQNRKTVNCRATGFDNDKNILLVDGTQIKLPPHLYILINKPVGVVCSRTSDSHTPVFSLLPEQVQNHPLFRHLHVAGRLDEQSRGLVFLTTNGALSNFFIAPQSHLPKKYKVTLQNTCSPVKQAEYAARFLAGISLEAQKKAPAFTTMPAQIEFTEASRCIVTISEGKFHQVRRMFETLNNTVIDLQRTHIGSLTMPASLLQGQWAFITRKEIEKALNIEEK